MFNIYIQYGCLTVCFQLAALQILNINQYKYQQNMCHIKQTNRLLQPNTFEHKVQARL